MEVDAAFKKALTDTTIRTPTIVDYLNANQVEPRDLRLTCHHLTFASNTIPQPLLCQGAILHLLGKNPCRKNFYAGARLKADGRFVLEINPSIEQITEKMIQTPTAFDGMSAFGNLVVLKEPRRNILLLSFMQRTLEKKKSKRLKKFIVSDINQEQGSTRHYPLVDMAMNA